MPTIPIPDICAGDAPALFLDFDGTLVDIVARPDLTRVPPPVIEMLGVIHRRVGGALAVVTGRPLADLDRLLSPLKLPAAGIHGVEHRAAGHHIETRCEASIPNDIRERIRRLAGSDNRLVLEDKGIGISLHYRQASELEADLRTELAQISATLGPAFSVQNGKMVIELRPAGIDKGSAVEKFMSEMPFAGRRAIFIGDDVTDEDAFTAVNRMDGYSVKVGVCGPNTAARYSLPDVAAVHEWLRPFTRSPTD